MTMSAQNKISNPTLTLNPTPNTIPNNSSPTLPLSREELAAYMLSVERHTDVIEKMMQTFMDNQNAFMTNFCNSMLSSFNNLSSTTKTLMEQHAASEIALKQTVANNTPVQPIVPTLVHVDPTIESWKQQAYDVANQIAKQKGSGTGNTALQNIYKRIKTKDGVDIAATRKQFLEENKVPAMSIINFIANNEELRTLFDARATEMLNEHCPTCKKVDPCANVIPFPEASQTGVIDHQTSVTTSEVNSLNGNPEACTEAYTTLQKPSLTTTPTEAQSRIITYPTSIEAVKIPQIIHDELKIIVNKGYQINSVTHDLYIILSENYDVDFEQLIDDFRDTYKLKTVNRMYIISRNEELMHKFKSAVQDLNNAIENKEIIIAQQRCK